MGIKMTVQSTSRYKGRGGKFREVSQHDTSRAAMRELREEVGCIDEHFGQSDDDYLSELNRLGIHVAFEKI